MIMNQLRLRIYFGLVFGIGNLVFSWLILAESSPIYYRFVIDLWLILDMPVFMVIGLATGNIHSTNTVAICSLSFIQWFAIGYILSFIFIRGRKVKRSGIQIEKNEDRD